MSSTTSAARGKNGPLWLKGLRVQARVIHALMIRDAMGSYGHENLGFFWVIAEPALLMSAIMVLWSFAHVTHSSDVAVLPFALTGYAFLTMWRHIVNKSVGLMTRHIYIRYHRQVKVLDAVIARALLETVAIAAAFAILYIPLWLIGFCPTLNDPLLLVGGYVMGAWFSFGFGMAIGGLSELSESVHHVIPMALYVTMPITGAFTMQDWLPGNVQDILAWSPLVNSIEMFRAGIFPPDVPMHFSAVYLFASCVVMNAAGFHICRFAEHRMQA